MNIFLFRQVNNQEVREFRPSAFLSLVIQHQFLNILFFKPGSYYQKMFAALQELIFYHISFQEYARQLDTGEHRLSNEEKEAVQLTINRLFILMRDAYDPLPQVQQILSVLSKTTVNDINHVRDNMENWRNVELCSNTSKFNYQLHRSVIGENPQGPRIHASMQQFPYQFQLVTREGVVFETVSFEQNEYVRYQTRELVERLVSRSRQPYLSYVPEGDDIKPGTVYFFRRDNHWYFMTDTQTEPAPLVFEGDNEATFNENLNNRTIEFFNRQATKNSVLNSVRAYLENDTLIYLAFAHAYQSVGEIELVLEYYRLTFQQLNRLTENQLTSFSRELKLFVLENTINLLFKLFSLEEIHDLREPVNGGTRQRNILNDIENALSLIEYCINNNYNIDDTTTPYYQQFTAKSRVDVEALHAYLLIYKSVLLVPQPIAVTAYERGKLLQEGALDSNYHYFLIATQKMIVDYVKQWNQDENEKKKQIKRLLHLDSLFIFTKVTGRAFELGEGDLASKLLFTQRMNHLSYYVYMENLKTIKHLKQFRLFLDVKRELFERYSNKIQKSVLEKYTVQNLENIFQTVKNEMQGVDENFVHTEQALKERYRNLVRQKLADDYHVYSNASKANREIDENIAQTQRALMINYICDTFAIQKLYHNQYVWHSVSENSVMSFLKVNDQLERFHITFVHLFGFYKRLEDLGIKDLLHFDQFLKRNENENLKNEHIHVALDKYITDEIDPVIRRKKAENRKYLFELTIKHMESFGKDELLADLNQNNENVELANAQDWRIDRTGRSISNECQRKYTVYLYPEVRGDNAITKYVFLFKESTQNRSIVYRADGYLDNNMQDLEDSYVRLAMCNRHLKSFRRFIYPFTAEQRQTYNLTKHNQLYLDVRNFLNNLITSEENVINQDIEDGREFSRLPNDSDRKTEIPNKPAWQRSQLYQLCKQCYKTEYLSALTETFDFKKPLLWLMGNVSNAAVQEAPDSLDRLFQNQLKALQTLLIIGGNLFFDELSCQEEKIIEDVINHISFDEKHITSFAQTILMNLPFYLSHFCLRDTYDIVFFRKMNEWLDAINRLSTYASKMSSQMLKRKNYVLEKSLESDMMLRLIDIMVKLSRITIEGNLEALSELSQLINKWGFFLRDFLYRKPVSIFHKWGGGSAIGKAGFLDQTINRQMKALSNCPYVENIRQSSSSNAQIKFLKEELNHLRNERIAFYNKPRFFKILAPNIEENFIAEEFIEEEEEIHYDIYEC